MGDGRALPWAAASTDAVLLFGPLYHLSERADRLRALGEARRVLRPGGILVAAAISRFASTIDGLREGHLKDPAFAEIVHRDLRDGQHRNPTGRPGYFMDTFFHHPEELRDEVAEAGFALSGIYGVEGPGWLLPDLETWWADEALRERLLRLARILESEPSLLGLSAHLIAVAKRQGTPRGVFGTPGSSLAFHGLLSASPRYAAPLDLARPIARIGLTMQPLRRHGVRPVLGLSGLRDAQGECPMKLAEGMSRITEENLQFARQIGVTDIVAVSPPVVATDGPYYDFERLVQLRTRIEAAGLCLAAIQNIPPAWYHALIYGLPGREAQLEAYCRTIDNVGRAGIPILHYNWHAVKVWRTSAYTRDRGDALVTSYDHALMENAPLVGPRALGDEELWDNFGYFLRRIIPVAESAGVRMALHPDDPPIGPIAGAACLFRDTAAFQRALDLVPSPSNGLLFCQGCFTEMYGPGVFDAIRHFGRQGKVFYVHFRNVVGRMPSFRESFIDSGDVDMLEAMRTWQEVGFRGPMIPDHLPHITGDTEDARAARAHAIGYMKALMQAVGGVEP